MGCSVFALWAMRNVQPAERDNLDPQQRGEIFALSAFGKRRLPFNRVRRIEFGCILFSAPHE
jgi:hypothetical protein